MRYHFGRTIFSVSAVMLFCVGSIFASSSAHPSPEIKDILVTYLSGRASILLAEIQEDTSELKLHSESLRTFARNPQYNWQSHADYLHNVRDRINAVGNRLAELQSIRPAILPWQDQAAEEITSIAVQVAASSQAAITHVRENADRHFVPEYRQHLIDIADHAEGMKQTVDRFAVYAETQQKLIALEDQLELTGK